MESTDERTTYEPSAHKGQVRQQQFRPTSAPRAARSLAEPARDGGPERSAKHDRRDRPTSAPISSREGGGSGLEAGWDSGHAYGRMRDAGGDSSAPRPLDGISETGPDGAGANAGRPTSASSRPPYILDSMMERPTSGSSRRQTHSDYVRLPASGALRFVEAASEQPPRPVFSPLTSPQVVLPPPRESG